MAELYVLTGVSGAGKSSAQYVFEESGYYVMENIIPAALKPTLDYFLTRSSGLDKFLIVVSPLFAKEVFTICKDYEKDHKGLQVFLMTLTCDEKILLQRFKLTRHVHPLTVMQNMSLSEAIESQIEMVNKLSGLANYRIDTSDLTTNDLRKTLYKIVTRKENNTVNLCFMSFGHKHSIPMDVDLVLDTRALPNPYWVPELRKYSGLDEPVVKFLENLPITEKTFRHMVDYLDFYIEEVQKDGRGNYTIGVCCSGGRHRSVYFAERLAKHYAKKYSVVTIHRDIHKD